LATFEYSREEYVTRLRWLMTGRVMLLFFLLVTLIFFQYRYHIYPIPVTYLYYVLLAVLLLTGIYRSFLHRVENLSLFAYVQISADILLVTFMVYLTGGIDSGLSILYHLSIISASIILYRRGGFLSASLSSILYGAMLDMQFYNVPGFARSQNFTAMQVLYQVFLNIVSFYIVAFLSSFLSDRLRRTRQELREKSLDFEDLRSLQEHILRSVGSGILTMDLDGRVTSWNPAAEYITGYGIEEIRKKAQEVFGTSIKSLFGHASEMQGRAYRFDSKITKKNRSTAFLGLSASLLKDDRNMVRGIILVFQDITRLMEMEEKVRRQERLATVGSLAAGIAHEIRNPLASLSGSIQLLQSELDLKGDDKRLMDIVLRETDRLNSIIGDFLDYARPKTPHKEPVSLASVVEETVLLLRNSPDCREGIAIVQDVVPSLRLIADPQHLRQVLWNLALNACQSMRGGGTLTISANKAAPPSGDPDWCEITVADTGQGIPREFLNKLFDPFFTTKADGTGLGLAIVYRIIEDHGGAIDVESEPGKGSLFRIRLPLEETTVLGAPGRRA
jgi:two-component system sensor histidine kinase PilS (NtrC family)